MKDPAALFYISDWLTSTSEMDADCRGWYLNLILHNYDKGDLPNDIEKLAVLAGVKFSEFNRFEQVFEQVLKQKFEQTENNRITNERTSKIIQARERFQTKRSNAGKLSYFFKFCYKLNAKAMTKKFKDFIKENIDLDNLDTKNEQMLKQVFEQMFELYRNENENENNIINKNIELIYNRYPSKCPVRNSATGKSKKDKDKIKKLLKTYKLEDMILIIDKYIQDCVSGNVYIKNFSTFLNNIPDYSSGDTECNKPEPEKIYRWNHLTDVTRGERIYTGDKRIYERELNSYGKDIIKLVSDGN